MYLDHFGLKEAPFRITPHTDFFFHGANRGATLDALLYAITHDEGIVKVSGEVGSGKTMLCRVLMERLPSGVETIYLANPSLSRDEILFAIADELKLDLQGLRMTRVLRGLQDHLITLFAAGRRVVVLIDEAHAMPKETLEEIRLLSNLESNRHKLLQLVLFGQPELDAHLDTADMRQLKERITHSFHLEPLVRSDIESYIDFRMRAAGFRGPKVFSAGAIKLMAAASQGLTRRINILADKSLLAAFAAGTHGVTEKEVARAVRDSEFRRRGISPQQMWIGGGALAAGLVLGWGIHVFQSPGGSSERAPTRPAADSPAGMLAPAAAAGQPSFVQQTSPSPQGASGTEQQAAPQRDSVASAAPFGTLSHTPVPPASGELSLKRFSATQEWLRSAPGDYYSIQVLTVDSGELPQLEEFLLRASRVVPVGDLFVYSVKIDNRQHYRVAYGAYPTSALVLSAMKELPAPLGSYRPYYRSIERMRSQNRQ